MTKLQLFILLSSVEFIIFHHQKYLKELSQRFPFKEQENTVNTFEMFKLYIKNFHKKAKKRMKMRL